MQNVGMSRMAFPIGQIAGASLGGVGNSAVGRGPVQTNVCNFLRVKSLGGLTFVPIEHRQVLQHVGQSGA